MHDDHTWHASSVDTCSHSQFPESDMAAERPGRLHGLRIGSNCDFRDITEKGSSNDDLDANTKWKQGPRPHIGRLVESSFVESSLSIKTPFCVEGRHHTNHLRESGITARIYPTLTGSGSSATETPV